MCVAVTVTEILQNLSSVRQIGRSENVSFLIAWPNEDSKKLHSLNVLVFYVLMIAKLQLMYK